MNNDAVLEQTQNLVQELRRGVIVLAVLSQLEEEQYGYSLMKKLEDKGMLIDQGTLYPLLRRLEEQGILASDWRVETSRPRRYYIMSDFGKQVLTEMSSEWNRIKTTIDKLLENIKGEKDETD